MKRFIFLLLLPFVLLGANASTTFTEVKGDNFRYYYFEGVSWNSTAGDTLETSIVQISNYNYHSLKLGGVFDGVDVFYMTACEKAQLGDTLAYWPDPIFIDSVATDTTCQPQLFCALNLAADIYIKFFVVSKKVANRTGCRGYFTIVDDISGD